MNLLDDQEQQGLARRAARRALSTRLRRVVVLAVTVALGLGGVLAVQFATTSSASAASADNPFGYLEAVSSPEPGVVSVTGWAADRNAPTSSIQVQVFAGGHINSTTATVTTITANQSRPDVAAAYPGYGAAHGFNAKVSSPAGNNVVICVGAVNVGAGTGNTELPGCKTIAVHNATPFGYLDSVSSPAAGKIAVTGWAADSSAKTTSIQVNIYAAGTVVGSLMANQSRPDVAAVYPSYGAVHGFSGTFAVPAGAKQVCAIGVNFGPGVQDNPQLGNCYTVTVH